MRRCILHVGMMKTGTSSIQRSLDGLTDAAFLWYEDRKGRTNHTPAIFGLIGADRPRRAPSRRDVPELDARDSFDATFQSLGQRALVVSGEGMLSLTPDQLRELAAYFRGRQVQNVTPVAYVRPPVGYLTSWARAAAGGELKSLRLRLTVRYREWFEKFDQVFGRENVRLWKFDLPSFPSGCVVQDFCARLGIDFPAHRVIRVNESLSREAVGLLYTYRKFGADLGSRTMLPRQRARLVRRLAKIGHRKFRFSPDLLQPFLEKNRAEIEWMEARLGQSLHEDLGERQADDVRDDGDLLRPDPDVVDKLRELLGEAAPKGVKGDTPEEVALLVHALRRNR